MPIQLARVGDLTIDHNFLLLSQAVSAVQRPLDTLPTDAPDGFEVLYQDSTMATDGVVWRFRYRAGSSSSFKWEFIGGSPMFAIIDPDWVGGSSETTASTSYVNLATVGPSITAPLAGDYSIAHGATMFSTVADCAIMSYAIGGAAASDLDSISGSATGNWIAASTKRRKLSIAASTAIVAKYRNRVASTSHFVSRWIELTPVRVSG